MTASDSAPVGYNKNKKRKVTFADDVSSPGSSPPTQKATLQYVRPDTFVDRSKSFEVNPYETLVFQQGSGDYRRNTKIKVYRTFRSTSPTEMPGSSPSRNPVVDNDRAPFVIIIFMMMTITCVALLLATSESRKTLPPTKSSRSNSNRARLICPPVMPPNSSPDVTTNDTAEKPGDLNEATDLQREAIEEVVRYLMWTNASSCALTQHFGGIFKTVEGLSFRGLEGQLPVCFDPPEMAPMFGQCNVYTFDTVGERSFEGAMEEYGCQVYGFDSHLNVTYRNRTSNNVRLFRVKLATGWENSNKRIMETSDAPIQSLTAIYANLGKLHGRDAVIDYLALRIDWPEWDILPQLVRSGMMDKVRQLNAEFHFPNASLFCSGQSTGAFQQLFYALRSIEKYGMMRFDSRPNLFHRNVEDAVNQTGGSFAHQITWYNSRFLSE